VDIQKKRDIVIVGNSDIASPAVRKERARRLHKKKRKKKKDKGRALFEERAHIRRRKKS